MTQSNCLICNNYHVAWPALQFWIIYLPLLTPLCAELKHGMYSQHNPLQMTPAMYLQRQWNAKQKSTVNLRICLLTKSSQVVDSTIFIHLPLFSSTFSDAQLNLYHQAWIVTLFVGRYRTMIMIIKDKDDDDCQRQTMMMLVEDKRWWWLSKTKMMMIVKDKRMEIVKIVPFHSANRPAPKKVPLMSSDITFIKHRANPLPHI